MRDVRAVYIIWFREIIRHIRDRTRIISAFVTPFLFLFVFGEGIASSLGRNAPYDYLQFLFPGALGMTVMMTALYSAISLVFDREFGFLKEILVAPIRRSSIVLGKILGSSTIATLQGVLMFLFAPLVGIELSFGLFLVVIPVLFLLAFSITCFGVFVASRIQSVQAFQFVMPLAMMPMLFLSGAFFPLSDPPMWLDFLSKIDPLTYGIDLLRDIFFASTMSQAVVDQVVINPWQLNLLVMCGFSIVMFLLSSLAFREQ